MLNAGSNTFCDSDHTDLNINESFLKSDIANVISKMYTPMDCTPEDLTATEDLCKIDQCRTNELDEIPINEVGYICKTGSSVIDSSPVVDSSTSDSVSFPRGKNELKRSRVICECCRRKISSRVVEKRVKITCSGCKICVKHGCRHPKQTTGTSSIPGAQRSQHNKAQGDCISSQNYSTSHYNHLKEMDEYCKTCQSNIQSMKMHEYSKIPPENISDSKASRDINTHNPSDKVGTAQEQKKSVNKLSKNIKFQDKLSLMTIFKSCVNKDSSQKTLYKKDVNDKVGVSDKTKTKLNMKINDGKIETCSQISDLAQAKATKDTSSKDTVVEIQCNKTNQTKSSIEWNTFWFDLLKPARQVLAFFSGFILSLLKFVLDSLVRPLLWESMQTVSNYFFRPCLETVFYSVLQPIFVLLTNIASSMRDLCLPIAQCFGYFLKEFAISCRAYRIVDEPKSNTPPEEIISNH
uniref:Uncharacterized protein n=1 Tax=Graphocephala atropunctata TaxID=36148 RepID=A0A1B6K8L6_9HEMI